MSRIVLPCPNRQRRIPRSFSWVDHRLVRDGHVQRCEAAALALYLVLITVGDCHGISYYADRTLSRMLQLSSWQLRQAREQLLHADLIGYRSPVYQVLDLAPVSVTVSEQGSEEPIEQGNAATAEEVSAIVAEWLQSRGLK